MNPLSPDNSDLWEEMELVAKRRGISTADAHREAIQDFLEKSLLYEKRPSDDARLAFPAGAENAMEECEIHRTKTSLPNPNDCPVEDLPKWIQLVQDDLKVLKELKTGLSMLDDIRLQRTIETYENTEAVLIQRLYDSKRETQKEPVK